MSSKKLIPFDGSSAMWHRKRAIDRFLTGREHLLLFAELYHIPKQEALSRIATLLKLVSLEDDADRVAKGYSGGMKRKT